MLILPSPPQDISKSIMSQFRQLLSPLLRRFRTSSKEDKNDSEAEATSSLQGIPTNSETLIKLYGGNCNQSKIIEI